MNNPVNPQKNRDNKGTPIYKNIIISNIIQ